MNIQSTHRGHSGETLSNFFIGLYPWIMTVSFGAVLLDVVYAYFLRASLASSQTATIFSEVADFLLIIGGLSILAALWTIGFSWNTRLARNLFIASLAMILLTFLVPLFFGLFLGGISGLEALGIGPWIRLGASGGASLLAFLGLYQYLRQRQS